MNFISRKVLEKMLPYVLWIVMVGFFLACGLRWFEKSNLYFPSKRLECSPKDIGLDFRCVDVPGKHGEKINCWIVASEPSRAILIFCHGNAGNVSHRLDTIEILHNLDLTVAIFDYPGYGQSTGNPHESTLYDSAEAVYEYLKRENPSAKFVFFAIEGTFRISF